MGRPRRSAYKGVCGVVTAAGLLASCSVLPGDVPDAGGAGSFIRDVVAGKGRSAGDDGKRAPAAVAPPVPFGLYVGAGEEGVRRMPRLQQWLGGTEPTVGHTYLPGDRWADIEGEPGFLEHWTRWRRERDERMFVLNVPMLDRSEGELPDDEVRRLLRAGASGRFDDHFRTLAERLVRLKAPDTVIVLGWEMNGSTYTHRCGPDPGAWKTYWRRIVDAMRSVRGQDFRFDFAPARGADSVPWTECYPGDEYVDIIGMDSYDQPADQSFEAQVNEAHGLRAQVDFAREHGKRISYPEWGLAENGDNAEYVRRMLDWFDRHRPVYHTLTDYCPHGVWQCPANPDSAETFRTALFRRDTGEGGNGSAAGEWGEGSPGAPGEPGVPGEPGDQASPDGPGGPGGEASPEASKGLPGGGVPGR